MDDVANRTEQASSASAQNEAKAQLRRCVRAVRDAMPEESRAKKSARICARLVEFVRTHVEPATADKPLYVGAFCEIHSETSMAAFREAAWNEGWHVCLPCMREPGHMEFYDVSRTAGLRPQGTGLPFVEHPARNYALKDIEVFLAETGIDPAECQEVTPEQLDMLVLPLVGFNDDGTRLGYGGGNYDRYLPQLRSDCWLAGVAFDEQQVPAVPRDSFDLAVPQFIHA